VAVRPKSGYIPTLDGWRAIAVGLVLLAHAPFPPGNELYTRIASYSEVGVSLFFAISGLLICSRLLEEERMTGRISLRGFYVRRSFRIFPAAYLYLLFVAVMGLLHWLPMDWPAWGSALLFLRNYFTCLVGDTPVSAPTGQYWSLAIEEHFYLLLPFLLVFFPKRRKLVLLLLTAVAFVWLALYVHVVPLDQRSIFWDRRTDLRLGALLFPAWIALFLAESSPRKWLARWLHPSGGAVVLLMVWVVLLLKRHYFPHVAPLMPAKSPVGDYVSVVRGGPFNPFKDVVVPLLFPLVVVSTMLHPATLWGRLLEWKPLRSIGRVSYSLYLWQQLFWVTGYKGGPIASFQRLWLAAMIAAPLLSYFLVEKPMIRWGHRLAPPATPGHRDLDADAPATAGV